MQAILFCCRRTVNDLHKLVFSKTLAQVTWQNRHHFRQVVLDEIIKIKDQPGKDMVIFGSANLAQSFIKPGLVDEYRITMNPIVFGNRMLLFQNLQYRIEQSFIRSHTFKKGGFVLTYQPDVRR
jgi:dihydrofolate reductase